MIRNPLKLGTTAILVTSCAVGLISSSVAMGQTGVIARVGETDVKYDEIRTVVESLDAKQREALAKDPATLSQLVRSLLVQRLVLKEALEKKWDEQPEVAAQLQRVRESAITESYLQSVTKPHESYPSDADLAAAYEANKAAMIVPRELRLAQIYIAAPRDADKATADKAQARLDAARKSLKQAGADFAAIAKAQSDDKQTAERGEIGWLPEPRIQPEIRLAVANLAKGATSEPVRMDDGWHIVKVLDVKDSYTPALAEVREQLSQQLRAERARIASQAYVAKLLQQHPVVINEVGLSSALKAERKD